MKNKIIITALIFTALALAQQPKDKLYIHEEGHEKSDRFFFIQDLETNTRCYAITNNIVNTSGYAISCVSVSK